MKVSKKSLILLALSGFATLAHAVDVTSIASSNYPNGWYTLDSTNSNVSIDATPTNDGDGALHFVGNGSGTVSYGAYPAYGGTASSMFPSLGTLGALIAGSMSGDFYRSSASNTINPYINVGVKIIFSGNRQLTWENAYNSATTTQDAFFSQVLNTGNWWLRGAGLGMETNENLGTLADWAAGKRPASYTGAALTPTSDILGYSLSYGSGVGSFSGAFDHLNVTYAGGTSTTFNFRAAQATPEPAPLAGLALGAVAFLRRRKRA